MASTQVTCGRKRSLLRTFGSRRRYKDFAVSISAPSGDAFATPTRPITEASPHRLSNNFDKVDGGSGSADGGSHGGTRRSQNSRAMIVDISSKRPLKNIANGVTDTPGPHLSPFEMHPVLISAPEPPRQSPAESVLRRNSFGAPYSNHGTQHNRRYTTNSAQLDKTAELLKLLETSTADMEDRPLLNGELGLPPQTKRTLSVQEELAGQRSSSLRAMRGCVHKASAEEINVKVREMLAATDALKPTTPQKTQGSRKLASMASSRVFTRMSDAIGRMYSKSASPEAQNGDPESRLRLEGIGIPLGQSFSRANTSHSSIRSTEIRLNEVKNLNRSKVQQIIGSQVFRQPIAFNENPALCRERGQQTSDRDRLASTERRRSELCFYSSSMNPFEAEDDFENNLENGILNVSPAGSSTPRICINRASGSSTGEDDVGDWSGSSIGKIDLARIVKVGKNDAGSPKIRQVDLQSATGLKDPSQKHWQHSKRERNMQMDDFGIAKKHPSPSKKDLEELELALQRYKPSEGSHIQDDADELANSNLSVAEALAAKDPNKKLRTKGMQRESTKTQQRATSQMFLSRIPRPSCQVGQRGSLETRLAVDCRPKNAVPGEPDELV
ncbi:hypothetical protein NOR_04969 [Metarhizium rileyi]|uniref:Uncharacterized protein n=1 Tax=Metarhizium rileyi (strain RCEF 4871) TaxID=1649241 RepID=A0A167D9W9_METRR|nr:hypothetical protein NOR_04969 [Metarhizium rileyi RCEF 4871]